MAVLTQQMMVQRSLKLQKAGNKVVFTNGCFDIIHRGHIDLLTRARISGDHLFVAINSDDSVRRLKGEGRPIQTAEDRAIILDAIIPVNDVAIFHEDTPEQLISMVRPNVLVKGEDYKEDEIVGADLVSTWGGQVIRIPLLENRGTQIIFNAILTTYRSKSS